MGAVLSLTRLSSFAEPALAVAADRADVWTSVGNLSIVVLVRTEVDHMTPKRTRNKAPAIVIDGKAFELIPERVRVDAVRLDADNPRIRYLVKSHRFANPTQEQLKDLLWEIGGVQELMRKIRNNKGAIDAILIKDDGTVIEGNCRVACYRHLGWEEIEAQRLPKISQREIDILLSKYHVSGKISWRSYAQAGQIYKLRHEHKMDVAEITRVTGIPDEEVKHLLRTYEIMTEKLLPKVSGKKGLKKFSYVYEAVKNPGLDSWLSKPKNEDEFVRWVAEGKLKKGADVRALPKIIKKPAAVEALRGERDGGKKAVQMVVRPREFETLEDALDVLGALKPALVDVIRTDRREQTVLKQLYSKIEDVAEMADLKL